MAQFDRGDVSIHYDLEGDPQGDPVLLIAPGGMRSANDIWNGIVWNPRIRLAGSHRLVGMDQRNAGRSFAPVSGSDGWHTYRSDQLGLLDHLGIDRCHLVGMCIGGPYILGLLKAAPERFASAVLLQPVGIEDNRPAFYEMFDQWAADIAPDHPEATPEDWRSFRSNMWDGEFVLTATPAEVAAMTTPMLVLMGNDLYHPESISRQVAEMAPAATLIESWKEEPDLSAADTAIRDFLTAHSL